MTNTLLCPICTADDGRDSTPQPPGDYTCPRCGDAWTAYTPEQRAFYDRRDTLIKRHLVAVSALVLAVWRAT